MRKYYRFHKWMLRGHPDNVTRAVKRMVLSGHNAGLYATSTRDGSHAPGSYHYVGEAVDLGNKRRGSVGADPGTPKARRLMVAWQKHLIKWHGCGTFNELFGPDNNYNCKDGRRITLDEGSALETLHDTHVHVAPRRVVRWPQIPKTLLQIARARRHGARYVRTIFKYADKHNISRALALALFDQESAFVMQYGHDHLPGKPPIWHGSWSRVLVTRKNYAAYKAWRNKHGLAQGVGLGQLTSPGYQDAADRKGGCWKPSANVDTALDILRGNIRALGVVRGIGAYNGGRGNPNITYAKTVLAKRDKWKRVLK